MVSDLFFYELALCGLLRLWIMLHYVWPSDCATGDRTTPAPATPPRQRPRDPQPLPGLTRQPHCAACEQAVQEPAASPALVAPARTERRHRQYGC